MGATPRSELFWLGIFNYINYHAFEKTASDVTYYLSHEESVTKAWFLRWAKDTQHSHPRGKVHKEMQWTISRRFSDCSNWALLQHLRGCTYCAVLLTGLWHCQARLMCQLPELGTAGMKHDKTGGWGHARCVQVTLSQQRRPKEAIAATSVLRGAMRHPKLHF